MNFYVFIQNQPSDINSEPPQSTNIECLLLVTILTFKEAPIIQGRTAGKKSEIFFIFVLLPSGCSRNILGITT